MHTLTEVHKFGFLYRNIIQACRDKKYFDCFIKEYSSIGKMLERTQKYYVWIILTKSSKILYT